MRSQDRCKVSLLSTAPSACRVMAPSLMMRKGSSVQSRTVEATPPGARPPSKIRSHPLPKPPAALPARPGAPPATSVSTGSGDGAIKCCQDFQRQTRFRDPNPDGARSSRYGLWNFRASKEHQGEGTWPESLSQLPRSSRQFPRDFVHIFHFADKDGNRLILRAFLYLKDPGDRLRPEQVGTQRVQGISGKGDKPSPPQDRRGLFDNSRIGMHEIHGSYLGLLAHCRSILSMIYIPR